ncbi:MAG: hypothetical protein GY730_07950 [bacterium]|nr:hypothetical protein [bacterium]
METIKSSETSHEGLNVQKIIKAYQKKKIIKDEIVMLPSIIRTILESKKSYKSIKKNITLNKTTIDDDILEKLKAYAATLGVGDIGFAKVKPEMIFKDKEILYDNAIVFLMEMKREAIDQAPSLNTQKEIFRTYYVLGKNINLLASFMRKKGYNVQAGPALDGDVNYLC